MTEMHRKMGAIQESILVVAFSHASPIMNDVGDQILRNWSAPFVAVVEVDLLTWALQTGCYMLFRPMLVSIVKATDIIPICEYTNRRKLKRIVRTITSLLQIFLKSQLYIYKNNGISFALFNTLNTMSGYFLMSWRMLKKNWK